MRVSDLSVDSTKLYKAHVELLQAWELTKEHWKDENSVNFEDNHLAPLDPLVKMLLDATNRLNEVFARVERDLANPGAY
jgi:Na+/phosphate symporter